MLMESMTIDLHKNAEKYCATFPNIREVLGIITFQGDTGALVRTQAGIYLHVTVGAIYSLPQKAVVKALQEITDEK